MLVTHDFRMFLTCFIKNNSNKNFDGLMIFHPLKTFMTYTNNILIISTLIMFTLIIFYTKILIFTNIIYTNAL